MLTTHARRVAPITVRRKGPPTARPAVTQRRHSAPQWPGARRNRQVTRAHRHGKTRKGSETAAAASPPLSLSPRFTSSAAWRCAADEGGERPSFSQQPLVQPPRQRRQWHALLPAPAAGWAHSETRPQTSSASDESFDHPPATQKAAAPAAGATSDRQMRSNDGSNICDDGPIGTALSDPSEYSPQGSVSAVVTSRRVPRCSRGTSASSSVIGAGMAKRLVPVNRLKSPEAGPGRSLRVDDVAGGHLG